jgi:Ca2+-binding RTX toxin-like protein
MAISKTMSADSNALEVIHLKPNDELNLDGLSYDKAQIEIISADIIVINPDTGSKAVFPGLGLILFDDAQAPTITFNGQVVTPKMFGDKIGTVSGVTKNDYVSFTSLEVTDEKPEAEEENTDKDDSAEVVEELTEENEKLQQELKELTEVTEESEFLLASLSSENAQLQAKANEIDKPPEENEGEFSDVSESGSPVQEENSFTSSDDASASSSASSTATETAAPINASVSEFSFRSFLLQPGASEATEDVMGTPTFVVRGGGGNADSTFNPDSTVQLSSEVLNYTSRTDDIVVFADDAALFDDSNLTRAVELVPSLPDGFDITGAVVSGLPAGFEIVGATFAGGEYTLDLSGAAATSRGNIQFDLKYGIPAFQNFDIVIAVTATFDPASGVSPTPALTEQTFILTQPVQQQDVSVAADLDVVNADGDTVWVLANTANENTILSGSGNDTLNGSGGIDSIQAGDGDDTVLANDGDDIIDGGAGDDTITGGLGSDDITGGSGTSDTVDYTGRTEAVVLDLNTVDADGYADAAVGVAGEVDRIRQVENITGGDANDTITGDANDNILIGGLGDDILDGGLGTDTIDGGDGIDTISFISGGSGLTVNLGVGGTINVGTGVKTISNIENITATNFIDVITATGGDNVISGADGDDTFITDGGGNDTFDGGFNAVDSGTSDLIDYSTSTDGITLDLSAALDVDGFSTVTVGVTTDLIKNIEDVSGSDTAADNITGDAAGQILRGFAGDDTLSGAGGDDSIAGGLGSDILDGGTTGQTIGDTLLLNDLAAAVTLTLSDPNTGTAVSGADTDTFTNFEIYTLGDDDDIINSSSGADQVNGGNGADTFFASAGADNFDGGGDTDTIDYTSRGGGIYINVDLNAAPNLTVDVRDSGTDALIEQDIINNIENVIGSAGDDIFTNGAANNVIDGAGGSDTITYASGATGISFNMNLTTGGFFDVVIGGQTDSIARIENIIGSTGDDTMQGDTAANNFDGNDGNDSFIASEGGDTYTGGLDVDIVRYDSLAGLNSVVANLATRTATLDLGVVGADAADSTDTYLDDLERLSGTTGDDTLTGNNLNNTIFDLGGDDVINGGGGVNTIHYSLLVGDNVVVDLGANTADDDSGAGALDSIINFDNAIGSNQGDVITGSNAVNILGGGAGNDILNGLGGDDVIDGGNDDDDIEGGDGDDDIDGGTGDDRAIYTGANAVTVNLNTGTATDGNGDTDTLTSIEEVTGSSAGDTIIAGSTTTEIDSGGGDDVITSNIQLTAGRINNIDGGTDNDTVDYTATSSISGASITGTIANISLGGSTDIVSNVETFRLGNAGDQFSIDTSAISSDLNLFDGNGGTDSVTIDTGAAGDLSAADIDGDTLAGIFVDIEAFDFRGTDLTGADQFEISDAHISAITGGGNSLEITIDGTNIALSDFDFLVGGGISNLDADADPNVQVVQWSSGAELTISVV